MNLSVLDRFWYTPAPAERPAIARLLVGTYALVYLLVRAPNLISVTHFRAASFLPVGPARLLSEPLAPWLVYLSWFVACASGVAFVLGYRYRASGPSFAAAFLWLTSYRSSWGMVFHTENLVSLHLCLLAVAPAADALSVDARGRPASALAHGRYGWPLRALCTLTVITYVLAGVAKLRIAGFAWADGELLRTHVAYDNLRKIELGSAHSPLGAALVRYAAPFRVLSWLSLALELGAPLALLTRRLAHGWVAAAYSFHLGVLALMAIGFPYPLSFVAYASFFELEALERWPRFRGLTRWLRPVAAASA